MRNLGLITGVLSNHLQYYLQTYHLQAICLTSYFQCRFDGCVGWGIISKKRACLKGQAQSI